MITIDTRKYKNYLDVNVTVHSTVINLGSLSKIKIEELIQDLEISLEDLQDFVRSANNDPN
jgi:hypothetical protein